MLDTVSEFLSFRFSVSAFALPSSSSKHIQKKDTSALSVASMIHRCSARSLDDDDANEEIPQATSAPSSSAVTGSIAPFSASACARPRALSWPLHYDLLDQHFHATQKYFASLNFCSADDCQQWRFCLVLLLMPSSTPSHDLARYGNPFPPSFPAFYAYQIFRFCVFSGFAIMLPLQPQPLFRFLWATFSVRCVVRLHD